MKLIIGLGNPEPEYSWTRHNAGKEVINLLAENLADTNWSKNAKLGALISEGFIDGEKFLMAKPLGYMNDVGQNIRAVVDYYDVNFENLLIIYDDLDFVTAEYKFGLGKGSKIHNGILSIEKHLKSKNYWHLRIGIRDEKIAQSVQKAGRDPSKYVLAKFKVSDQKKIIKRYEESLSTEITHWLSKKE